MEIEEPPVEEGAPAWMATFGDMMSLLLTFFVLMLSFATMDVIKFKAMAGSLEQAFGVKYQEPGEFDARSSQAIELSEAEKPPDQAVQEDPSPDGAEGEKADKELYEQILKAVEAANAQGLVEVVPGDRGVSVRVKGTLMFNPGDDKIRLGAMAMLDEIAEIAARSSYRISVEGHTDATPVRSTRFPTNWHLSTDRAIAGLLYLVEHGGVAPNRINAAGFAHTKPVVPGNSPDAQSKNRRLEFVFYRDEEVGLKVQGEELHEISLEDDTALELLFDQ